MAIDWSLFDPMAGAKLGAALDPALIQERQNKLADLAAERQIRQMQMQSAVEGIAEKRIEQAARKEAMKGLTPEELQQIQLGVPYKDILERKERERLAESLFPTQTPEAPTTFSPTATEATLTPEQFMGGDQVNLADSSRMMGGAPVTPIAQPMPTQIAPVQPTENIPSKEQVARMVLMGVPGAKELQSMYYPPEKAAAQTQLTKLMTERQSIAQANPKDPRLAVYDAAIKKETTPGGTNVSVNLGQRGFENVLKLRGDFRSEPIYKAHTEVQSAYNQIKQGLDSKSPAGDLAAATKFMKLLDPGSVVRESELAMAMQASGLQDRLANYADNILKGTKLTPAQRADFRQLADRFYRESARLYNSKRGEYADIASRNQLNVQDVTGAPARITDTGANPHANKTDAQIRQELGL